MAGFVEQYQIAAADGARLHNFRANARAGKHAEFTLLFDSSIAQATFSDSSKNANTFFHPSCGCSGRFLGRYQAKFACPG